MSGKGINLFPQIKNRPLKGAEMKRFSWILFTLVLCSIVFTCIADLPKT